MCVWDTIQPSCVSSEWPLRKTRNCIRWTFGSQGIFQNSSRFKVEKTTAVIALAIKWKPVILQCTRHPSESSWRTLHRILLQSSHKPMALYYIYIYISITIIVILIDKYFFFTRFSRMNSSTPSNRWENID